MFRSAEEYSAFAAGRLREIADWQTRNAAERLREQRLIRVTEALRSVVATGQSQGLFNHAADVPAAAEAAVRILERD